MVYSAEKTEVKLPENIIITEQFVIRIPCRLTNLETI
jgi:hypothetical protein